MALRDAGRVVVAQIHLRALVGILVPRLVRQVGSREVPRILRCDRVALDVVDELGLLAQVPDPRIPVDARGLERGGDPLDVLERLVVAQPGPHPSLLVRMDPDLRDLVDQRLVAVVRGLRRLPLDHRPDRAAGHVRPVVERVREHLPVLGLVDHPGLLVGRRGVAELLERPVGVDEPGRAHVDDLLGGGVRHRAGHLAHVRVGDLADDRLARIRGCVAGLARDERSLARERVVLVDLVLEMLGQLGDVGADARRPAGVDEQPHPEARPPARVGLVEEERRLRDLQARLVALHVQVDVALGLARGRRLALRLGTELLPDLVEEALPVLEERVDHLAARLRAHLRKVAGALLEGVDRVLPAPVVVSDQRVCCSRRGVRVLGELDGRPASSGPVASRRSDQVPPPPPTAIPPPLCSSRWAPLGSTGFPLCSCSSISCLGFPSPSSSRPPCARRPCARPASPRP